MVTGEVIKIEFKRSIHQSLSVCKQGPLCDKLCERIVSQFKDNVSQCKIAKYLGLSPSTVHNIMKRFREGKSQYINAKGWNCCWMRMTIEPQAVLFEKPSCYHDGHSHMGSGEYSNWKIIVTQYSALLNQENATWNCIMQRGRHLLILRRNASEFSGAKVMRWTERQWQICSLVRRVHISACFGEKPMSDSTCQRWKRQSRLLPTKSAKTSLCDGMGVHQCPRHGWSAYMWRYHWCGGLCWNFGETYAAVKTMTFPRNSMSISAGQCQASFYMSYNSVAS